MSDQDGPFIRRPGGPADPGRPGRRVVPGPSPSTPPPAGPPRAWSETPDDRGPRGAHDAGRYAPRQEPQPYLPGPPPPRRERRPAEPGGFRRDERLGAYEGGSRRSGPPGSRPPSGPPPRSSNGPPGPSPRRPRRRRRIPIVRSLLILLLVIVVGLGGLVFYYDSKLTRVDALSSYPGRVRDTPGTNWLLVGSDSRAGLSDAEKRQLATGDSEGSRTDTIMLIHVPSSGKAMIISIPRDLYVTIPGQGPHKINAAFAFGGPRLLVQTIETLTKVHIDHYAEIGFGGFDKLVDSVGGVNICLDKRVRDPKAGINLRAGCQDLDGRQALGLVRTRAFNNADLERVVNQRKFLSALMSKASGASTVLNPFRLFPFVSGTVSTLTVDNGDHIWNLAALGWALRNDPLTTTTPNSGPEVTDDGDSVGVGDNTTQFFDYIAKDVPVPTDLLVNTGGAIS